MRTTVTLDEGLVRQLVELTGEKTKTAAVSFAVREAIRREKMRQLADLLGRVDIDEEAIAEGREADARRAKWLEEMGSADAR